MDTKSRPYQIVELSSERRVWLNILDLPRVALPMYGLLEVDVTVPRQLIAGHKARTGESLSFTGYLTTCLARAVEEHKAVQSYRKGSKQVIQFEQVDVGLMIERQIDDKRVLTGYVVRDAGHKTVRAIHEEIRTVQSAREQPSEEMPGWFFKTMLLPWPFSKLVKGVMGWVTRHDPLRMVEMAGTVGITAVGMFGKDHSGWGFEQTRHSLALVVGSIAWKPAVVEGRVEPREMMNLTVIFDHHVVDGAPAARFTRYLVQLIESGFGLDRLENPPDKT